MKCVFCDIVAGIEPADILFESKNVIAFLDRSPFNIGHTLVIPKVHCENYLSMPDEITAEFFIAIKQLSSVIKESLNATGINIITNIGKDAGQTVYHTHYHIIPRFGTDEYTMKRRTVSYKRDERKELAAKIVNILGNSVGETDGKKDKSTDI